MFMAFILLLTVLIAIFSNVLFYTVCLLAMSVTVLVWLVCSNYLSTLILLLVVVVYVGAMMILIGYICAVSPNFNLSPSYEFIPLVLFVLGYLYSSFYIFGFTLSDSKLSTLLDYFFSSWGVFVFLTLVFMLFLTLLIVTSQYSSPQGPFRSL